MNNTPRFAIVGHPNKGKSSIVATLSHNDTIAVSEISGTTQFANHYPYSVDGKTLYQLVDTPGFQRPRQLLEWLTQHASHAGERQAAIKIVTQLPDHDACAQKFKDEIELLTPIIAGAGIIYVVDGSVPYSPEYEAEMTILQWSGQPRMALINPIGGDEYVEQWQQALGQFFSIVRVFNPMTASRDEQRAILSAFAELSEPWRQDIQSAIALIEQQDATLSQQTAHLIANTLHDMICFSQSIPQGEINSDHRATDVLEKSLQSTYQTTLRQKELQLQKQLAERYSHLNLNWHGDALEADYSDMFDQGQWYLFGLDRKKLVTLSTAAGAATGALLDVGLGGASLMIGAIGGGLLSGAASLLLSQAPENIQIKGMPLGGKTITVGPVKNLQFSFVLLGRMLDYQHKIATRAHADRSTLELESTSDSHWLNTLSHKKQVKLTYLLKRSAIGLKNKELTTLKSIIAELITH